MKVIVNGTFDLIHPGHLNLLNYAKQQGTHLTVAIDSDRRVRDNKGPNRPIMSEYERMTLLRNLRAVDHVVVFDTDEELLSYISQCDIMVKGSDWQNEPVIGADRIQVVFYPRLPIYSTTKIYEDIINRV